MKTEEVLMALAGFTWRVAGYINANLIDDAAILAMLFC
jgi:hypothetical protein